MIKKLFLLTIIFLGIFQIGNVFGTQVPDFNVKVNIPEPTTPKIDFGDTSVIVPEVSTDNPNKYNPGDKYDGVTESNELDDNIDTTKKIISEINKNISEVNQEISEIKKEMDGLDKKSEEYKILSSKLEDRNQELKKYNENLAEELKLHNEQRTKECEASGDCIDKKSFMFDTVSNFGIGPSFRGSDTSEGSNVLLGTIIQKLMVALGVLSVLIMTVGGGYIILYHGQDELLSKGKSIFMSGIIALVIALSSYMIVGLLRFILYNN